MSGATRSGAVIVGGPPHAELLPPEVGVGVKARGLRRLLVFLIFLVAGIVAALVVGATFLSAGSATLLASATDEGNQLIRAQGDYAEVRQVTTMIGKAKEGLLIGSTTEVRWKAYIAEIQASLPAGTFVTNFSATAATPTAPYAPPSAPLQGDRIGELIFTATSATLPDIEAWLNGLEKITGFVDASPGTVVLAEGGTYTVNIVMHINAKVFDNPFVDDPNDDDDAAPAESAEEN